MGFHRGRNHMMPHEVNAIIAKIIFVVSAACVLCMAKVRAHEVSPVQAPVSIEMTKVSSQF